MSRPATFRKLAAQDSFIGRYMRYMSPLETPVSYDFWSGLWILSTVIGRSCIVNRPRAPVFLNLYLFLLAESGVTRKSTSIRFATDVIRLLLSKFLVTSTALKNEESRSFGIVAGKTSPEQFLMELANRSQKWGNAHTAISISEMVTFFGRERYTLALPGLLTDLYDCPAKYELPGTLKHGALHLQNVYITLLSASTPSWLAGAINPNVVEGGFTSRVIICNERRPKKRVPWPAKEEDTDALDKFAEELAAIREFAEQRGEIPLSVGARKYYDKWYKTRILSVDPYRTSFESREDDHLLRIAALLTISNNKWLIDRLDISAAASLLNSAKADGASIFAGAASQDRFLYGIDKIREYLIKKGKEPTMHSELYGRVRTTMSSNDLWYVMDIMHELEMVNKYEVKQPEGQRGKPRTVYVGTQRLTARNAMEVLVDVARRED